MEVTRALTARRMPPPQRNPPSRSGGALLLRHDAELLVSQCQFLTGFEVVHASKVNVE